MSRIVSCEAPDISVHNGNVNFKAVRNAGYPQVYLRAGYGKNNVDQKYIVNAEACRNLNIPVMIYWFSYALNTFMSDMEAEYAIAQARKYWTKCPIGYDLEYDTVRYAATKGIKIDKTLATDMAIAFLKKVSQEGYLPVIYLNKDYKENYFDMARIRHEVKDVKIWYARYNVTISSEELADTDVWQYTSKGKINGVSGNVDINKVYGDLFVCAESAVTNNTCNLRILEFQRAANADGYVDDTGSSLIEDGVDGKCTQAVRKKIALKAKMTRYTGSTGELVCWWQTRLNEILGERLEVDGMFGKATRDATLRFQKLFALKADGIAGYNTIQMAFYQ